MRIIFCILALICMLLPATATFASTGHYINGLEGNGVAAMPPKGLYWRMYNAVYTADAIKNNKGDKINVNYDLDVYLMAHRFIYATDFKILGARLGADIILPFVYTHMSIGKTLEHIPPHFGVTSGTIDRSGSSGGFSDIQIDPIMLSWSGSWYDVSVAMGLFIPTGRFDADIATSPGKGFWTFMPSAGFDVYFDEDKTWSATFMAHYEIHTRQAETRQTQGNHFHFEWGAAKRFWENWQVGIAGYCMWQITEDSGPKASSSKSRTFAAGPEISFAVPSWGMQFSLRSLWEIENRNTAQGNISTFTVTYGF